MKPRINKKVVIPTEAGANATVQWRNLLFRGQQRYSCGNSRPDVSGRSHERGACPALQVLGLESSMLGDAVPSLVFRD
jgi:hypothetical protein